MVQFPTISNADPEKMDFGVFDAFHEKLAELYPLLHGHLTRTIVGRANLLYHWTSPRSTAGKAPVILMAHQDVVPTGDPAKWTYPPFSGTIADGCVWGRGSGDCKSVILGEMEAVESLIAEGFVPDYDIYLAYSENEEVMIEKKGAKELVAWFAAKGIHPGAVLDEGGGIEKTEHGYVCRAQLGEKAFQDYEFYQECAGGHSMAPGRGTALGAVCRAIAAVEEHPFPYRLTPLVESELKALSQSLTGRKQEVYADPAAHFDELCAYAADDRMLDALLHTTCAATMASASFQSNVLPDRAAIIVNVRVLEGDTIESVMAHFQSIIPANVKVRLVFGEDPGRSASVDSRIYRLIEKIAKDTYGQSTVMVPCLLPGGTDARFYQAISDHVFRHTGYLEDARRSGAHQPNEKVPVDTLATGCAFYRKFLKEY